MSIIHWREVGLVYLSAQLFPFWKHLQYKPIDRIIMLITTTRVPIIENILTFKGEPKLCGYVLCFVIILLTLKIDTCFISRILLAKTSSLLSVRCDIFRDCIKLKLFIFEYDLLKFSLYSGSSMVGSTFNLLLDGRTKVIAFASQPLVGKLYHMGSRVWLITILQTG